MTLRLQDVSQRCIQPAPLCRQGCLCSPVSGALADSIQGDMNVHRYSVQSLIAMILAVNLSLGMAASPAVGVVTAPGSFTIDHASIAGNATLFEGNRIETGKASSHLQL